MEEEIWKDVVGYEGLYEVSNLGNIRSLNRSIIYKNKEIHNHKSHYLKTGFNLRGYKMIVLSNKDRKRNTKTIHSIVLTTFIGPKPEGMECCHNNGDKTDNRLSNLRWDTHKNNTMDKFKHNTIKYGRCILMLE